MKKKTKIFKCLNHWISALTSINNFLRKKYKFLSLLLFDSISILKMDNNTTNNYLLISISIECINTLFTFSPFENDNNEDNDDNDNDNDNEIDIIIIRGIIIIIRRIIIIIIRRIIIIIIIEIEREMKNLKWILMKVIRSM